MKLLVPDEADVMTNAFATDRSFVDVLQQLRMFCSFK